MGTSHAERIVTAVRQDHPHAYGDKRYSDVKLKAQTGSSPRVWGQANHHQQYNYQTRIIPTRMGTSVILAVMQRAGKDHPHAYGDKFIKYFKF